MPRILVIEDDLQQADIYGTLLYYNGFDITHASTVAEGIRSAGRERPDLILLDFRLPGTNGFAAISMLRNLPQIGDIPLISFSAYDVSPDSVRKAGAVDFLRKPIAGDDLVRAIRKVIGRGETPQGGAQRKRALLIAPRESPAAGTFARLLDRHGFTISRTADGATGIGVANTISPDVVLVHLDIAGVDAARVVQRLGSESQTARIPVFAISDAPPGDLAEGVISRGFAGYFQRADDVAAAEIERVTQARSSD